MEHQDLWQRAGAGLRRGRVDRRVVEETLRAADRVVEADRRSADHRYGDDVRMKGSSRRPEQVAETVRQVIADALLTEVRDPRVGFVTVTGCRSPTTSRTRRCG